MEKEYNPAIVKTDDQKHVEAVNIVFLILLILPQILIILGVDKLLGNTVTARLLFSQAIYILPVLCYLIFVRRSVAPCRFKRIRISNILLCVLMYICLMPVLTLLNTISYLYSATTFSNLIFQVSSEIPYPVAAIVVALIPAFCEELTYRGVFYNTYRKVNPLAAIFLSGALFGLLHGNLNQITYAVALGIIFSLIVEATDSIFSSMIVHCLVNLFSTTMVYVLPRLFEFLNSLLEEAKAAGDTQTIDMIMGIVGSEELSIDSVISATPEMFSKQQVLVSIMGSLFPAAIGGFLAFMLFRFISKRCGRWEYICDIFRKPEKSGKIFTIPLIIAFVLMIALIVMNELAARGIIG
ncbi:MAG: CPBP family intramembrane metalloprotease [Lachnospiraceae bacterium]|nr:CPBP family intramembrane metalloprotease [Lachnospiraceae bacterium]